MRASLVRLGLILTAAGMVLAARGGASEPSTSGSGLAASRSANPNTSSQQAQQTSETCTFDVECEDGNPCTMDRCIIEPEMPPGSGKCAHDPVTPGEPGGCDDGVFCNGRESCDENGQCVAGIAASCCAEPYSDHVCHETAGRCAYDSPTPDRLCASDSDCFGGTCDHCQPRCTQNSDCDDGQLCNGMETCNTVTGQCEAGPNTCDAEFCGNDEVDQGRGEECDGTDDAVCPGACMPFGDFLECQCCVSVCGNAMLEYKCGEECDTVYDYACPGLCIPPGNPGECTCGSFCGNGFREPDEECDGGDSELCPGRCQPDCTCPPSICGNELREAGEECDGTNDIYCRDLGGTCRSLGDPAGQCTCTCGAVVCGPSLPILDSPAVLPSSCACQPVFFPFRKMRYLDLGFNPEFAGKMSAMRVELKSLDWFGVALGYQFVNLVGDGVCPDSPALGTSFRCARLSCMPDYRDWEAELDGQILFVTGDAIVPNSTYSVAVVPVECMGRELSCEAASCDVVLDTALWGDVNGDRSVNIADISNEVDVLKAVPTGHLPKYHAQVQPNEPDPSMPVSVSDLANMVDALKGFAYPFAGPTPCP